jgi:Zn finger protein HypA/HybF involved in hydrogenase expression
MNEYLKTLSPEQQNAALDKIAAELKANGVPQLSLSALNSPSKEWVRCCQCDVWHTLEEVQQARACPKCGNVGDFETDPRSARDN